MAAKKIAVIEGDGIGKEVVPEGVRVLEAAARRFGLDLALGSFRLGLRSPRPPRPDDARERARPDRRARRDLSRRDRLADGLRRGIAVDAADADPARLPAICESAARCGCSRAFRRRSPIPAHIDFLIVRENNEGEYSEIGGRIYPGTDAEAVIQETVFTRRGCDRVIRFAFELARSRPTPKLTSATKSNGIIHTMPFWDERFRDDREVLSRRRDRAVPHRHPDRAFRAAPGELRRGRRQQSVRRHPLRPRAGGDRHDRHRALGQSQSGAALSVDVRAGARLGARHRRQGTSPIRSARSGRAR